MANEILADKISVLSSKMIFRRAKDIVDVYALAHCVEVHTEGIYDVYRKNPARVLGTFDELYKRRQDVEHAYEKLRGIEGKPDFINVYSYLSELVRPFAECDKVPKIWNSGNMLWESDMKYGSRFF